MAKGQKRSTREAKKPKAGKKPESVAAQAARAQLSGKTIPPKSAK